MPFLPVYVIKMVTKTMDPALERAAGCTRAEPSVHPRAGVPDRHAEGRGAQLRRGSEGSSDGGGVPVLARAGRPTLLRPVRWRDDGRRGHPPQLCLPSRLRPLHLRRPQKGDAAPPSFCLSHP